MMIIAEELTKHYGKATALDHVSFTIEPGESVALWGANGAGKTTTLRCLLGVHSFEGALVVNGINVRQQAKAVRAVIGYVPQEAVFYDLTVYETLRFYARLKKTAPDRIPAVLEQVQLVPHSAKRVSMLSGGMKQRLALAAALLADPPILVLDEPTANLDVAAQREFIHTIQVLNQAGKTIVFSSHRLDEVIMLASRVLILENGSLVQTCPPTELAEKLGLQRWLRIWVAVQHQDSMLRVLREQGFAYTPNGRSAYVKVTASSKIAPLRSLELAHIPVEDFDLVEDELVPPRGLNHD
ncbi:MAG: ABC transporter ATP-binding protein [Anaerolineaceae bacterium]|nr:ABC transporter ATP-binding protein [Anaerolineaceae bacterium]